MPPFFGYLNKFIKNLEIFYEADIYLELWVSWLRTIFYILAAAFDNKFFQGELKFPDIRGAEFDFAGFDSYFDVQ